MGRLRLSKVTKLDDQELIEIALSEDVVTKSDPRDDEVSLFIREFDMEPGEERVTTHTLYTLYCGWNANKEKRLARITFFRKFAQWFEPQQQSGKRFYKLNVAPSVLMKRLEDIQLGGSSGKEKT